MKTYLSTESASPSQASLGWLRVSGPQKHFALAANLPNSVNIHTGGRAWQRCFQSLAMLLLGLCFWLPGRAQAAGSVLILQETVSSPATSSREYLATVAAGCTPVVVNAAMWATMTTVAAYTPYKALIVGDPNCGTGSPGYAAALTALNNTKAFWGPAVTGNIILAGVDNALHAGSQIGAQKLLERGIQFSVADPAGTGFYYALSCYYDYTAPAAPFTPVPHLDNLIGSSPNAFKVRNFPGQCFNNAHIVATHAVFTAAPPLTDSELSSWGCSVHEGFDAWPASFVVLAIASNNAAVYIATDGTRGVPYILVRGLGVTANGTNCLAINNRSVDCMATNMTYQWQFCVTNTSPDPIKYLSILDLPAGVTVNQDIVTLPSVLTTGQGTCLTLYVTNTPGLTNMCFTVGAHTTNFFKCCSVTNCITFAPCCVYFSAESVVPVPGSGCYNYTFTVKNVTVPPVPIKYLFLVQDPAPPPTCVTFTPDIVVLPPLLPGASIVKTVKVCFGAGCKGPFYFLAGASDTNLLHCCSTRHCIPPASIFPVISFPGGFDGSVFGVGTITVPVVIDTTYVLPSLVRLYEGTNVIYSATNNTINSSVLSVTWSNVVAGTYTLLAEELDTLGGVWDGEPATVYVVERQHPSPAPAPMLLNPALAGGNVSFTMQTAPGATYQVECSASLISPNWQPLQIIVGDGGVSPLRYPCTNSQMFYRVRVH